MSPTILFNFIKNIGKSMNRYFMKGDVHNSQLIFEKTLNCSGHQKILNKITMQFYLPIQITKMSFPKSKYKKAQRSSTHNYACARQEKMDTCRVVWSQKILHTNGNKCYFSKQ